MTKKCLRCGSENMDEGNLILWGAAIPVTESVVYRSSKHKKLSKSIKPTAYVCLECGFVEMEIDSEKLKKKLK
jgi:predicted nucleic-acid-binding Zn-ribbon protein